MKRRRLSALLIFTLVFSFLSVAQSPALVVDDPSITTPVISGISVNSISGTTMDVKVTISTSVSGLAGFQYSTDTGTTWSECNTSDCNWTTGNSYIIIQKLSSANNALQKGTTYSIVLRACTGGTASSASLGLTPCSQVSNTYVYKAGVPDAPTITSVTPGNQSLSVAFTAPASNGGSTITTYQYTTDGTNWLTRQTGTTASPISITTLSLNGTTLLTNGTAYPIQIRAVNSTGSGGSSNTISETPRTVPSAPTGLTGSAASSSSILIWWTIPASNGGNSISNYTIQYSRASTVSWSTFSHGTLSDTSVTVTGLIANTGYIFKVAAVNAAGTGAYSDTSTTITTSAAATNDATLNSGQVKGVTSTLGDSSTSLTFTSPGSVTLTQVQANNTSNSGSYVTEFITSDPAATYIAKKYTSSQTPLIADFSGATSDTSSAISDGSFYIIEVTPQSGTKLYYRVNITVQAPIIATSSTISYGAVSPSAVVTSNYYSNAMTTSDLTVGTSTTGLTFESITVVSTSSITLYFSGTAAVGNVTIQAKTTAFNPVGSAATNTLTIAVGAQVPNAPTSVVGTSAGSSSVSLTWVTPSDTGGATISDYDIQYSSDNGATWSTFTHTASATTSITVTGLSASTAYVFKVAGINSAGTGAYSSNSPSVTTDAAPSGGGGGGTPPPAPRVPTPPSITSISKTPVCSKGSELTLRGTNLGNVSVTVDGKAAEVRGGSSSNLLVYLPENTEGVKTIVVTNSDGSASYEVTYLYKDKPAFTTYAIPFLYKGGQFSFFVTATNALSYSYNGNFPSGLSLNQATGEITGSPTQDGQFNFHIVADGFCGQTLEHIKVDIDREIPNAMSYRIIFRNNNNRVLGPSLTGLRQFIRQVNLVSPRNITPLIYLSGGVRPGDDENSPGSQDRYNAICDILSTYDLLGQIMQGIFTGPDDEIEIIVYWPIPQ